MEDVKFEGSKIGKGELQKQMMDITEANRKAGLEASRAFAAAFEEGGDGLTPERAKQLQDGLDAIAKGYKDINDQQLKNLETSRSFSAGWNEAFASYKDDAFNAAMEAKTYFDTFSKGFEDVFVKMVQTGKLSFKDLANTMIAEFARIESRKLFAGLFGGASGGGLFSGFAKMLGFANGGVPPIGVPSIVGERGPELFVPRSAGTIVPNNQLGMGTNVTYNINAVDASSFRQLLARDPEFLYAVTEKGRSAIPSGRR
jgi:phage-related minor tail protein